MKKRRCANGFTLVEVFLVIAISSIIITMAVPIYGNLIVKGERREAVTRVISNLRLARANSSAGKRQSSYGVYFDASSTKIKMILYQGDSYVTRESEYDQVFIFGKEISITTTYSNNDINFSRNLEMLTSGEVVIGSNYGEDTLQINELGLVKKTYE